MAAPPCNSSSSGGAAAAVGGGPEPLARAATVKLLALEKLLERSGSDESSGDVFEALLPGGEPQALYFEGMANYRPQSVLPPSGGGGDAALTFPDPFDVGSGDEMLLSAEDLRLLFGDDGLFNVVRLGC